MSGLPRFRLVQGKAIGERSGPPPTQQQQQPQQPPPPPPQPQQMPPPEMHPIKQEMDTDMMSQEPHHQQGPSSQMMQGIKQEEPIPSPSRQMMGGAQSHQMMPQRPQMMQQHIKQELDPLSPPRGPMMGGPPHMLQQQPQQQQRPPPQQMPQQQHQYQQQQMQHQNPPQQMHQNLQNPPPGIVAAQQQQQQQQQQQNEDKNVQKCVRFLKTLISLSQNEDAEMPDKAARVRTLIQGVIYMETTAEEFTRDLQQVLKSQAQPHLLPFLQNTLPALRNAVRNGTANVDGVNPPPGYVFNNGRHPPPGGAPPGGPQGPPQGGPPQQQQHMPPQQQAPPPHGPPGGPVPGPQQAPPPPQQLINRLNADNPAPRPQPQNFQPQRPSGPPGPPMVKMMSGGPPQHGLQNQNLQNQNPAQIQMPPRSTPQQAPSQPMEVDEAPPLSQPQQRSTTAIRSAILKPDELLNRITKRMTVPCQVEEEALVTISDAVESHLREMIAMMAGYAEHRVESMRVPDNYVPIDDVKRQLRFLEDLDRQEEEMRENREKESLIRMSKNKNIGKETIEKAKEMQRADAEAKRNRDANAAAIAALSSNRNVKSKWEGAASTSAAPRPRTVRVTTRDLHLLVNQDNRFMGTFIREKLSYGGPAIDTTI